MQENLRMIAYLAQHDPAAVVGLAVIGIGAVLFIHVQFKMVRAGYKTSYSFFRHPTSPNGWDTPFLYLKVRMKHNWSPWPAYLCLPCMVGGMVFLVVGLFRL